MTTAGIILLVVCLGLGAGGAWAVSRYGHRIGLTDAPSQRSSHRTPTPKGGGIGILAAFIVSSIGLGVPWLLWVPLTVVSLMSLFGDYKELSPSKRLAIQLVMGLLVFWWVVAPESDPLMKAAFSLPAVVFIVGTANFYNFMDGINGIAGISAVVGFGLLVAFGLVSGLSLSQIQLPICLGAACLGFLPFNIPKAKVFMGDVGSVLLGFLFGVLLLQAADSLIDLLVLSSFLFTFYADELTTMVLRFKRGENLLKAHRSHAYQLLANEMKTPHLEVSLTYGAVQLVVGTSMLLLKAFDVHAIVMIVVFVVYCAGFVFASYAVRKTSAQRA